MKLWTLAKNTFHEFGDDDCSTHAQSIAYSAFFSLFPLLLGAVGILGYFISDPAQQQRLLNTAYANMPASGNFVADTLQGVIKSRGSVTLVATLLLIASGRTVILSIVHALDIAFDAPKERGFLQNILLAFKLLFSVGLLFVLSLGVTAAIQALASMSILGFGPFANTFVLTVVQLCITLLVSFAMFLLLYRMAPNVPIGWRDVWPGAALAAVLFEVAKLGFVIYVRQFLNTEIYGAIGGVIVLLTWCYFSSLILLVGAEFASEDMHLRQKESATANSSTSSAPDELAGTTKSHVEDQERHVTDANTSKKRPKRGIALAAVAVALVASFVAPKSNGRTSSVSGARSQRQPRT